MNLRYGLNPHQPARVALGGRAFPLRAITGAPSYVNLLDALNAWALVSELHATTGKVAATSFKHVSPAGAAIDGELDGVMRAVWHVAPTADPVLRAYVRARDADPKSSFGDMIAVSAPVTVELARFLATVVADGIIAPEFEAGTVEILEAKKRGSFLTLRMDATFSPEQEERRDVFGVELIQHRDDRAIQPSTWNVVAGSDRWQDHQIDAMVANVTLTRTQSNSVLFAKDGMCLGIGAGQQSRVDCTRLAGAKTALWWMRRHPMWAASAYQATDRHDKDQLAHVIRSCEALLAPSWMAPEAPNSSLSPEQVAAWVQELQGVTAASDGYLPFADNIEEMARYGVACVVEPGGSMRSEEVTDACRQRGITLVHTKRRLFHH